MQPFSQIYDTAVRHKGGADALERLMPQPQTPDELCALSDDRYLASMGIYVFEPQVLRDVLTDNTKADFGKEIIPDAIGDKKVMAFPFNDYWRDIGTIDAFFEANLDLCQVVPSFNLYDKNWPISTLWP